MGSVAGKSSRNYTRDSNHAGSWYEDDGSALNRTLQEFLDKAELDSNVVERPLRGLVCPHAGYSYSGQTAAYSYKALREELTKKESPIRRILVLHPSHHVYLEGCAVSGASTIATPIGDIPVDDDLRNQIINLSGRFTVMDKRTDDAEHSGEMQYPFISKVLQDSGRYGSLTILPVMCGALSTSDEEYFGQQLSSIVAQPDVLTIVSTDFCHWGKRFSYQPTANDSSSSIHEYIQQMDRQGMDLIEMQKPGAFAEYLKRTRNTICGRHAVAVWLRSLDAVDSSMSIQFVRYAQSSEVKSMKDSSVSYAAAVAVMA